LCRDSDTAQVTDQCHVQLQSNNARKFWFCLDRISKRRA